jgi:hypothetical protein
MKIAFSGTPYAMFQHLTNFDSASYERYNETFGRKIRNANARSGTVHLALGDPLTRI